MIEYHVINTEIKHHIDTFVDSIANMYTDAVNVVIVFLVTYDEEFSYSKYPNIKKLYLTSDDYRIFYFRKIWKNKIIMHFINSPIKSKYIFFIFSIIFRTKNLYIVLANGINLSNSFKDRLKEIILRNLFKVINVATLTDGDQNKINEYCNKNVAYLISYKTFFKVEDIPHEGINIMVCHSGFPHNQHQKVLEKLSDYWNKDQVKIYMPMSYGQKEYIEKVEKYLSKKNILNVYCVKTMMKKENYNKFLNAMDIYVTGANIQTGLFVAGGFLYMGKPFVVGENLYNYFTNRGFITHDIDRMDKIEVEYLINRRYKENSNLIQKNKIDNRSRKLLNLFINIMCIGVF